MRWALLLVAPLALAGNVILLMWDRNGQYLYNATPYYHYCRLEVDNRYQPVYWDLEPGQRTVSYSRIRRFSCK